MSSILFVLTDFTPGGAQRTVINLVNNWPENKIKPVLVVGDGRGDARRWLDKEVHLIDLGVTRVRSMFFKLRRVIHDVKPDIVFSTMIAANFVSVIAAMSLYRKPVLVVRETNSHIHRSDMTYYQRIMSKITFKLADRIIALSHGLKDELAIHYGIRQEKITVIHNPVSLYEGYLTESDVENNSDTLQLLSVGRLVTQKGYDIMLRVIASIKPLNVHLTIVGEGAEREHLEGISNELGLSDKVTFAGHQNNISDWYKQADIFLLTSRWEGFGHVIVEAMSHRLPVIAMNCPYGPADIINHSSNGVLVENGNIEAMSEAIKMLHQDAGMRGKIATEAIESSKYYRPESIALEYSDVLNKTLGKKS